MPDGIEAGKPAGSRHIPRGDPFGTPRQEVPLRREQGGELFKVWMLMPIKVIYRPPEEMAKRN